MPNFADDLNVYKSPNVSQSSTFKVIADNFYSLESYFLKLNGSEQPVISKSFKSGSISISASVNKCVSQNFVI